MKKYFFIGIPMVILVVALVILVPLVNKYRFAINEDSSKWDPEIEKIESRRTHPLTDNTIIFIGSSTIRRWKTLEKDMAPLPVANHGFGGGWIADMVHYAHRLVTQFNPHMVVFYAGSNDTYFRDLFGAKEDTPQKCLADFKSFVEAVHRDSPQAHIYFLAIKHSIKREKYWPHQKQANDLISQYSKTDDKLSFIDISEAFLMPDGHINSEYLEEDGLHPSQKGYERLTSIIKPILVKDYAAITESAQ